MRLRIPSYYRKFRCLAGSCRHSCCIGWEIDIDEDTFDYYREIGGDFGDRLKRHMKQEEVNSFTLTEEGRCPFLNRENLCDICIELGEEALSEVCTEYPRFVTEYADVREKSMALSCEEVGRLIFESREPFSYEEIKQTDYEAFSEDFDPEAPEEWDAFSPDDPAWYEPIEKARDAAIGLLQKRNLTIAQRISVLLGFGKAVQDKIRLEQPGEILQVIVDFREKLEQGSLETYSLDPPEILGGFEERFRIYEELEVLDEEWRETLAHVTACFSGPEKEKRYADWHRRFEEFYRKREYEYEHLLVYFVFRYTMQTVYDCNFMSHMCYAAASLLMIQDMDVVRFMDQGGRFTLEDRIDLARIYSREVEHSEENLELLQEAFQFR
ncbi:MAG: flagellin lysine-N-methylase [Candidatus Limivivens sp.]|nr:flagellin lysine-N-methylase [Candidatus Limivivens sp.]